MPMSRPLFRPVATALLLLSIGPAPVIAAAEFQSPSTAEGRGAAAALDVQIAAELRRLEGTLDPVSAGVVRDNQAIWTDWLRSMADWGKGLVGKEQVTERDLAEAAVAVRQQHLTFLRAIKAQIPDGVVGGWGDGITEVLLERGKNDRAKLVSVTNAMGSRSVVCVVEGKAVDERGGITIISDTHPDRPIHVGRKGVALSVEDSHGGPDAKSPHCQDGGKLAGQYFYIEGADKIMPWLMN